MNKTALILLCCAAFALNGCDNKPKIEVPVKKVDAPENQMPPNHPPVKPAATTAPNAAMPANPHADIKPQELPAGTGKKGKVLQVLQAGSNIFMEVQGAKQEKIWIAMPKMDIKAGDTVEYPDLEPIPNFHSKSLNRTFDKIILIKDIRVVK